MEPTGINGVHSYMRSNTPGPSAVRNFIVLLEVTAGDAGLDTMLFPDIIIHCHLVRHRDPPTPSPRKEERKIN